MLGEGVSIPPKVTTCFLLEGRSLFRNCLYQLKIIQEQGNVYPWCVGGGGGV